MYCYSDSLLRTCNNLVVRVPGISATSRTTVKKAQLSQWHVYRGGKADSEVRIAYGSGPHRPQYASLQTKDSYMRLNSGPDSGWGTSIVTMPIFWSDGKNHQGTPVAVEWVTRGDNLLLMVTGTSGKLETHVTLTIRPPLVSSVSVRVAAEASGTLSLDDRPGEAFKPVFLSSMHISDLNWDTCGVFVGDCRFNFPGSGYIVAPDPPVLASTFGLYGGNSQWKKNAPTVTIDFDRSMQVAGWQTRSKNPNGDNVGIWAAADTVLPSWTYDISITPAHR